MLTDFNEFLIAMLTNCSVQQPTSITITTHPLHYTAERTTLVTDWTALSSEQ